MTRAIELLEVLSDPTYKASYAHAKATTTCIKCKKPARSYRDAWAKLEYEVSGLCQECQDYFFNEREMARKVSYNVERAVMEVKGR
jgi:hypothetical protein